MDLHPKPAYRFLFILCCPPIPPQSSSTPGCDILQRHPRGHLLIFVAGFITILLLVGAVIALVFWALQTKEALEALKKTYTFQEPNNATQQKRATEDCSTLRQFLCRTDDQHSAENSRCGLCPENWRFHEGKCYWISKDKQTWNTSQQDCAAKDSQIVMIQREEELVFIKSITEGAQLLWIGLTAAPSSGEWIWVDGSPLNHTLLQVIGTAQANSCAMLKGNRIIWEACSAVMKWICETKALLV
ncbi:killer cell lectin-like receptor subfamily F member 2 [Hemicordylus capensis]|uniref:killer cell lectin-like receptor subfamily F member 2 n=1 Tax=Hemicordylus capensis TaxID=884348 RepID=UPI002303EDAC|nr:killer cell lectin-like receptor subfamily F member 2 [Hemicordylus capensis]